MIYLEIFRGLQEEGVRYLVEERLRRLKEANEFLYLAQDAETAPAGRRSGGGSANYGRG